MDREETLDLLHETPLFRPVIRSGPAGGRGRSMGGWGEEIIPDLGPVAGWKIYFGQVRFGDNAPCEGCQSFGDGRP